MNTKRKRFFFTEEKKYFNNKVKEKNSTNDKIIVFEKNKPKEFNIVFADELKRIQDEFFVTEIEKYKNLTLTILE